MSVRVLFALFIGVLLAAAGLVLLVWLLWKLWTHGERRKEAPVVEFELETQPPAELPRQEPERFSPPVEGAPPAPPPVGEPETGTRSVEEPALIATGDDVAARPVDVIVEEPAARAPLPGAKDDLKLIEGIGPRIAGVLQEAGIDTFARLAATDIDRLQAILREADPRLLRLADPRTWAEQARLAAAGEWDALTELQRELRGGRRDR